MNRRDFLKVAGMAAMATAVSPVRGQVAGGSSTTANKAGDGGNPMHPLLDIHIHQQPDNVRAQGGKKGGGRSEAEFLAHQKAVHAIGGVILGGNDHEYGFMQREPGRYVRFASAGTPGGDRAATIEKALKGGARGIGEHRWEGDIPFTRAILDLARDYQVPILFHFQESLYPAAVYSEFYKTIEKYPTVTFIGHAIDWWGAIDKNYRHTGGSYQRGRVTPGGLTDQWLTRYPNLYGDLSAQSGNTAILRDPDFAKDFITRHQDKLMFGSDCPCTAGGMPTCWAGIKLVALNFLQLSADVRQKIYLTNASKLLQLKIA